MRPSVPQACSRHGRMSRPEPPHRTARTSPRFPSHTRDSRTGARRATAYRARTLPARSRFHLRQHLRQCLLDDRAAQLRHRRPERILRPVVARQILAVELARLSAFGTRRDHRGTIAPGNDALVTAAGVRRAHADTGSFSIASRCVFRSAQDDPCSRRHSSNHSSRGVVATGAAKPSGASFQRP